MSASIDKKFNIIDNTIAISDVDIMMSSGFNDKISKKNNLSAFTLAEVMVIMAVMTVVLAAVAPIFTSRLSNMSDTVWGSVGASNMNDIYSDAPIRSMMNEILIGITPINMEDIRKTYQPYSKVIIRSSDRVGGNKRQKQIEFRFNGSTSGYLFAGNTNILLGGKYPNLSFTYKLPDLNDITKMNIDTNGAYGNTALGGQALNALTNGKENTAFGAFALNKLTTGNANTAAGTYAGSNLTTGIGNTLVGYRSYDAQEGDYNTILSNNSSSISKKSNYTTAVGNNIPVKGDYNVAIGDSSNAIGSYNTAIGYGALRTSDYSANSYTGFKYNTAIGYNACKGIGTSAKYKTCIGGVGVDTTSMGATAQGFFTETDEKERVFIGKPSSAFSSAATLEVHNLTSQSSKYPYPNNISSAPKPGDASVVVNGNLIVRGQTFMLGRSPFPIAQSAASTVYANTVSLMGYKLYKESILDHKPLIGWDGSEYTQRIKNNESYLREAYTGREHCICNYSCSNTKDYKANGYVGRDSYDWSYLSWGSYSDIFDNSFGGYNYFWGQQPHKCGTTYNVTTHAAANVELDAAHNITDGGVTSSGSQLLLGGSCCPILTESGNRLTDELPDQSSSVSSDIRLKNVGSEFNIGFESLAKLKIYNFRFKNDKSRNIHSGVIAQDLKRIFPNSVSKDAKGYYKIRKDEMFYSAVNSVKELYSKIMDLTKRIGNDVARIMALKKENKELKNKLLLLSKELDKLEK